MFDTDLNFIHIVDILKIYDKLSLPSWNHFDPECRPLLVATDRELTFLFAIHCRISRLREEVKIVQKKPRKKYLMHVLYINLGICI